MTLVFLMDYLNISVKINNDEDIHREEKYYYQLLEMKPLVDKKFKSGIITEKRYKKFIKTFRELEGKYEQNGKRNNN